MKHLRKFNESLNKEELQDFCDTYLAYLLDEGYSIEVSGSDEYVLVLRNENRPTNVPMDSPELLFTWEEVKDQFIPFLHMLSKQYTITRSIKFWVLNKKFDRGTAQEHIQGGAGLLQKVRLAIQAERAFLDYDYDLSMVLEDRVSLEEVVQINIYLK